MIAGIIGFIVTMFVLIKMMFSDMSGGGTIKETIVESIKDAKEMHDEIAEAMNEDYEVEKDKK